MKKIVRRAHAKINLGLEVLYKRPDDFHEINTLFLPVSLYDEIEFVPSAQLNVECTPELNIPQEENLVYRAAELLRKRYSVTEAAKIRVKKQIPSGAGLGGGSSDAAATLLGLCELWGVRPEREFLRDAAASLGSDVPFFLETRPAFAGGRGEELEYTVLDDLSCDILIVCPDIHISTPWAYKQLHRSSELKTGTNLPQIFRNLRTDPKILQKELVNDFETVVFPRFPELNHIKMELYGNGAFFALMSGSGSSIFGLFDTRRQAEIAAGRFAGYKTYICRQIAEQER